MRRLRDCWRAPSVWACSGSRSCRRLRARRRRRYVAPDVADNGWPTLCGALPLPKEADEHRRHRGALSAQAEGLELLDAIRANGRRLTPDGTRKRWGQRLPSISGEDPRAPGAAASEHDDIMRLHAPSLPRTPTQFNPGGRATAMAVSGSRPVKWCTTLSASSPLDVYSAAAIAITSWGSSTRSVSAFVIESALMSRRSTPVDFVVERAISGVDPRLGSLCRDERTRFCGGTCAAREAYGVYMGGIPYSAARMAGRRVSPSTP